MKALVFTAPGTVEMLDVGEPSPGPDEVLIDVAAVGICGSELHGIDEPGSRTPPLIMGHEFAGTTPDGRRVAVNPIISCGACGLCRAGSPQLCRDRAMVGIHRPGGFAERVAVPWSTLHELPDGIPWEAAAMIEPIANAVHAWSLAAGRATERVGIIGAGTIGLVCLLVSRDRGADEVAIADLMQERLEVARRLGATETGSELHGEFDVIIDAVGLAGTRRASVGHLRRGGTAVWLGLMEDDPGFDATELVRSEKRVLGSFAYTHAEFDEALGLARRSDLSWAESFPLGDAKRIFDQLGGGRADVVKALLRP